jgi:hypothetical protein
MARRFPGAPPPPQLPGRPTAAVLAVGRMLLPCVAVRQTDCRLRCQRQSSPYARAPPAARRAPPQCWSAPRPLPVRRSTGPATTCSAPGRALRLKAFTPRGECAPAAGSPNGSDGLNGYLAAWLQRSGYQVRRTRRRPMPPELSETQRAPRLWESGLAPTRGERPKRRQSCRSSQSRSPGEAPVGVRHSSRAPWTAARASSGAASCRCPPGY